MPEIRTESISKTFPDGTRALDSVSLEVKDGELLVLVGPSGCGKTTLLRVISGLESATQGDLFFDDTKVTNLHPNQRDLGMVFQNYALFPHLSILRNIMLGLEKSSLSKKEKKQSIQRVAQKIGLTGLLDRKPSELSGGQRQRVALARLLVRNPSIHLLDEPLSNLDANLRMKMREEIANLHLEHRKTTIFVTHDQIEAMTLGERICLLNLGKIEQIGTPQELYLNPQNLFVANFFGIPSINLLNGSIFYSKTKGTCKFTLQDSSHDLDLPFDVKKNQDDLVLGLRPENIRPDPDSSNLDFKVQRIEYLGDSQIIHLCTEEITLTSRQKICKLKLGQKTGLAINWETALWFNRQSHARIQLSDN